MVQAGGRLGDAVRTCAEKPENADRMFPLIISDLAPATRRITSHTICGCAGVSQWWFWSDGSVVEPSRVHPTFRPVLRVRARTRSNYHGTDEYASAYSTMYSIHPGTLLDCPCNIPCLPCEATVPYAVRVQYYNRPGINSRSLQDSAVSTEYIGNWQTSAGLSGVISQPSSDTMPRLSLYPRIRTRHPNQLTKVIDHVGVARVVVRGQAS